MAVTREGLAKRQAQMDKELGDLAYERLRLTRRVEAIDRRIAALEAAIQSNDLARRDLNTDEAIQQAKAEAAAAGKEEPHA